MAKQDEARSSVLNEAPDEAPDETLSGAKGARPAAGRRGPRPPKPVTEERLHRAALWHLERWSASAHRLRQALARRVARSVRLHGTDPAEAAAWVEAVVARLAAAGVLNDRAHASGRAMTLFRQGLSQRAIALRLAADGIGPADRDAALAAVAREAMRGDAADGMEDADAARALDMAAAMAYARRRRIGPFRPASDRAERRMRDMAALARRGFSADVARAVMDSSERAISGDTPPGAI